MGVDGSDSEMYQGEKVSVVSIVLPLLAVLAVVPFLVVLANVVYNNR